jgi:DNA-binding transcriptional LysR family regulator
MDLKRLRTFVAVAEQSTVSKAAETLRITQPALSRQIAALEQELGFKLFARVGRQLKLTARGEQLLADCRSLLAHAGSLRERAQALRHGEIKVLRIAVSALTLEGIFPTFLHACAERFPTIRLNLVEAVATEHLNMLERGEVDLAVNVINVVHVDDHRFASHLLPQFHIMAACGPSLEIEPGDAIDIRRLVDHPLLLLDSTFATRNLFDAACRIAGVRPSVFVESSAAHALLALAAAGHGIAVIPSILCTDQMDVQVMRVTHRGEALGISLAVLWDRRRTLPRHAEGFSELLAAHVREVFRRPPRGATADPPNGPRAQRTMIASSAVTTVPSSSTQENLNVPFSVTLTENSK